MSTRDATLAMIAAATETHPTDIAAGTAAQFLSDALTEATGQKVLVSYEQVAPREYILVVPTLVRGEA